MMIIYDIIYLHFLCVDNAKTNGHSKRVNNLCFWGESDESFGNTNISDITRSYNWSCRAMVMQNDTQWSKYDKLLQHIHHRLYDYEHVLLFSISD